MMWNIVGSLLLMAIFSVGALVIYFVLKGAKGGLNNQAAAEGLLKYFGIFVAAELIIGAVVGWIVGPIIFQAAGVVA